MNISREFAKKVISDLEGSIFPRISNKSSEELFKILFDESRKFPFDTNKLLRSLLISFFDKELKNLSFLDLGSGYGVYLLDGIKKGYNVVGVEPGKNEFGGRYERSIEFLEINGIKEPRNYVYEGVGECLSSLFKDKKFDVVYSIQVLEHVNDIEKVLKETYYILNKPGLACFSMPNYNSFYEGHYMLPWIPIILLNKKIAKLYVRFLFKREPDYLDEINFTTPTKVYNIARKISPNSFLLRYSTYAPFKIIGLLTNFLWLLRFYLDIGHYNKSVQNKFLKEYFNDSAYKDYFLFFGKVNEYFPFTKMIISFFAKIFSIFVSDFFLILIKDER